MIVKPQTLQRSNPGLLNVGGWKGRRLVICTSWFLAELVLCGSHKLLEANFL